MSAFKRGALTLSILALIAATVPVIAGSGSPGNEGGAITAEGPDELRRPNGLLAANETAPEYQLSWSTGYGDYESGSPLIPGMVVPAEYFYVFLSPQDAVSVVWETEGGRTYVDNGYPWRERVKLSELGAGEHTITATVNGETVIEVPFVLGKTGTSAGVTVTTSATLEKVTTTTTGVAVQAVVTSTTKPTAQAAGLGLSWSTSVGDYESGSPLIPGMVVPAEYFYVFLSPQDAVSVVWETEGGRTYVDNGYPWRERVKLSELGAGEHTITATVNGETVIEVPFVLGKTGTVAESVGTTTTTKPAGTTTTAVPRPAVTTTTAARAAVTTTTAPKATVKLSGVAVSPGESIQAAVDKHPGGTTFVIKAGVHKRQSVIPKAGNTFVGESGAVLSGENATAYAFGAKADNVTVKNLVIEKYSSPKKEAAIVTLGGADGWRIEGNEIRYNQGSGIRSGGKNWHIVGNYIHHNQVYGMTGTGTVGLVVEGNEIAFNNYQKNTSGGAGGSKWFYTRGLVVRDNYSHDNGGPGLWTDGHNEGVLYDGNRVVNNTASGIKHEASCDAVIRNNTVEGNGFATGEWMAAGIRVSLSPDVEVHHNAVSNNRNGVTAVYSERSYANTWCPGPNGQHQLKNLWVHDNTITMPTGQTGVVTNTAADKVFGSWNNRFDRNTYVIGNTAKPFEWKGDKTITEWKNSGQDPNSTWK